ncbi:hypothetical protein PGB90_003567 [Kerria lacca]
MLFTCPMKIKSIIKTSFLRLFWFQYPARYIMHSSSVNHYYNAMKVKVLPALSDNYMYLLIDQKTNEAAVVDPVDPATVIQTAYEENVFITTILTTHHHWDHAGGNVELVAKMKGKNLVVVGGDERVQGVSKIVKDGEELKIGSLSVKCLHTPCHTTGHICYFVTSQTSNCPIVFTGDTLFIAGCGRFFEGTAEMMNNSLNEKLARLPDETKVFCGHEYTNTNLKFAQMIEPNNIDVINKLQIVANLRQNNEPTVPSTIGEEKKINPFMRVNVKTVMDYAKVNDVIQVMAYIRKKKDSFKL